MTTANRASGLTCLLLLALVLPTVACGDDTSESTSGAGGGAPGNCGTVENPDFFTLADVTPASAPAVDSLTVVHSFRVVDAPGIVQQLAFQTAASHTAGAPTPEQLNFTVTQEGADLIYTGTAVTWANAGHVELSIPARYDVAGCVYAFPSPLYSYNLAPPEGTGGGGTGGGGTGGEGTGGEGTGGDDSTAGVGGTTAEGGEAR